MIPIQGTINDNFASSIVITSDKNIISGSSIE
jgi:hypothetical protein